MEQEFHPIRYISGIALGWSVFATREEAEAFAKHVFKRGDTYNGGYYHGQPLGHISKVEDGWRVSHA